MQRIHCGTSITCMLASSFLLSEFWPLELAFQTWFVLGIHHCLFHLWRKIFSSRRKVLPSKPSKAKQPITDFQQLLCCSAGFSGFHIINLLRTSALASSAADGGNLQPTVKIKLSISFHSHYSSHQMHTEVCRIAPVNCFFLRFLFVRFHGTCFSGKFCWNGYCFWCTWEFCWSRLVKLGRYICLSLVCSIAKPETTWTWNNSPSLVNSLQTEYPEIRTPGNVGGIKPRVITFWWNHSTQEMMLFWLSRSL